MGEEKHTESCSRNMKEGDHFEYPGVDGRIILKWIFEKCDGVGTWTGSIWLSIRTGGEFL
jgi:hypothetical protein